MKPEREIQIICATRQLAREYVNEFHRAAEALHLRPIARRAEVRRLAAGIAVFLLDQSGIETRSKQVLKRTVERLAEVAPVIVVAAPERQSELTALLSSGSTDFVARMGNFVPVAVGLVKRRLQLARMAIVPCSEEMTTARSANFGEILRHEVNNPLTGILGNAEMLLARRDGLPASAIERLETIAHLAVRLRETVRRLSSAAELPYAGGA
jgi:signal transduction histidine kinase